jgi:hypothetical protein
MKWEVSLVTLCPRKVVGCVGRLLGKEAGAKLSYGSSPLHTPKKASSTLHVEAKLCTSRVVVPIPPEWSEDRKERRKEGKKFFIPSCSPSPSHLPFLTSVSQCPHKCALIPPSFTEQKCWVGLESLYHKLGRVVSR